MIHHRENINYADDDTDPVARLFKLRIIPLVAGLFLGVLMSLVTSRFEKVLTTDVRVAFFLPFIVYMADAVGTQTQTIFARERNAGKATFKIYLRKESMLGVLLGTFFGIAAWGVAMLWFRSPSLASAVGLAMFGTVSLAPLVALIVDETLRKEHQDPAVGAGPLATVVQDTISILLYGVITTAILIS